MDFKYLENKILEYGCIKCLSKQNVSFYHQHKTFSAKPVGRQILPGVRSGNRVLVTTGHSKVPVCYSCQKEFERFKDFRSHLGSLVCFAAITLISIIISVFAGYRYAPFFIGLAVICGICSIYPARKIYKKELLKKGIVLSDPDYYIKHMSTNKLYIRPEGIKKWMPIQEWILYSISFYANLERKISTMISGGVVEMSSQEIKRGIEIADHHKYNHQYRHALRLYENLFSLEPQNMAIIKSIDECYIALNDHQGLADFYKKFSFNNPK